MSVNTYVVFSHLIKMLKAIQMEKECCCCCCFETGFLCVTALTVLELALVDQAVLELTEICLPLPPKCWD